MVKPVDPGRSATAVYETDLKADEAERTIWHYRGLTARENSYLRDRIQALEGTEEGASRMRYFNGTAELLRLRFGLRPPENFAAEWRGEKCTELVREDDVPTDAFLDRIPAPVRTWLAGLIADATVVTEDDAGESSRPSTSAGTKD